MTLSLKTRIFLLRIRIPYRFRRFKRRFRQRWFCSHKEVVWVADWSYHGTMCKRCYKYFVIRNKPYLTA